MGLIDGDTVPCLVCGAPMTILAPCPCKPWPIDDKRWDILVHNSIVATRPSGACEAATQLIEDQRLQGEKV